MSVSGGVTVNDLDVSGKFSPGVLTLNTPLTTTDMFVAGVRATIAQPNGSGSTITVNGTFTWNGGTIGSQTGSASNLILNTGPGNTSVSDTIGGSGFVETLGDNLAINSVSPSVRVTVTLTQEQGNNLVMTNNANINVNTNSWLNLVAGSKGITSAGGSTDVLTNQSTVDASGSGINLECIPIVNSGTSATLIVGDTARDATTLDIPESNPQNGVSVLNNGGDVVIFTGADLTGSSGFTQQTGSLQIQGTSGQAKLMSGGSALTNSAKTVINGGNIGFQAAGDTLYTTWDFNMTGGIMTITVDATAELQNGVISYGGNITIANGATVTVNTVNIPAGGMPHILWQLFVANAGKLFGNNSVVTVGSNVFNFDGFTYTIVGNGQPTLYLQS